MFIKNEDVPFLEVSQGVRRKILANDGALMAVEVHFEKGAIGQAHTHAHEQISYILSGSFLYQIEGEKHILKKGDNCYVAPDLLHGVEALEDNSVILDIFTPQREDFKS